ncbi:MAG: DMT family transporter [Candidatus Bathyarchaeia archaeon]
MFSSVIIFGFTTIIDKLMLAKRLSSFSYYVTFVPPAFVFSICVLFFFPTNVFSIPSFIAFAAGMISCGGYFLYAISMKKEEASRISALTSLSPAFVAVLAVFLVNEIFSAQSYVGIALMILGGALISYKRNNVKKLIPISLVFILIATNLAYSLDQTFAKISLDEISFWPFLMMFMFGRFVAVIPGFAINSARRKCFAEIGKLERNFAFALVVGSISWTVAIVFFFYAASLGPITLVSTISIISPLFTLVFATLLSKHFPKILKEEIDRKTLALKLFALLLIFIGTYLIIA